jgi:diguanylate cyclase (GGDEF)-like protein
MPISEHGEITGTVVSFHDITERKAAEQKLRDISITDELTGVLNRRGFFEMAERQLKVTDRMKGELFLLFADIDDLKVINDTLGHQVGDQLLVDAGNILRDTFRQTDIIGRLGGDEFAVLLPDNPGANSEESVLIRLEENADNFNKQKSRSYKVMISSGVIKYDVNSPCNIDELLIKADKLMFVRKKERKGETEIR